MHAALCDAARGDLVKAREIYKDVVETTLLYSGFTIAAELALSLGDVDEAIDLMERAVEDKSWLQFYFRVRFKHNNALKDHPRYLALLQRIGLDDDSVADLNSQMSFDQ